MMATEFATGTFWPPLALSFVLLLALKFAIALSVIILTMERTMAKLDRLAHTDMLTGLGNRRFFFEAVPANLQAGDAIVVFDADRFKKLNDTWGHVVGDKVLQAIAQALAVPVRSGDVLARYGGEEFILFLPATGEAGALTIADRMRAAVEATTITDIRATISAGIAISPASGTSLDRLIREADAALYDAKAAGRNACRVSRGVEHGEADYSPAI
jgi:diguanylate cyclase (GGDEF)-like protein